MARTYILNQSEIDLKLRRMALEIAERNTDAEAIILAGIIPHGLVMAEKLNELLPEWFAGSITLVSVDLNKRHPEVVTIAPEPAMDGVVVILVDDVANSGKTLSYALKPFLNHHPQKIQTLVLVDRTHKKFPIQPDYVGFSLATTLQEYVEVEVNEGVLTGAWAS